MKPCAIYFLRDPTTQEIRYVGITTNPAYRYYRHRQATRDSHKDNWIRSLEKPPILQIVCWSSVEFAKELEIRLIAKLPNLTNASVGGEGIHSLMITATSKKRSESYNRVTAEIKKRRSEADSRRRAKFLLREAIEAERIEFNRKLSLINESTMTTKGSRLT